MRKITITMNRISGRNKIPQFSLTNLAETLTTMEANLILFLKQQNAIKRRTPKPMQMAPITVAPVLFSWIPNFDDSLGTRRNIPNRTSAKIATMNRR